MARLVNDEQDKSSTRPLVTQSENWDKGGKNPKGSSSMAIFMVVLSVLALLYGIAIVAMAKSAIHEIQAGVSS